MTFEIGIVLAVIAAALVLWISELLPIDLVAICIPVALVLTGVLDARTAFSGFSSVALLTIAAIFVVSQGLLRTGAVTFVGNWVIRTARGDYKRLLVLVMVTMVVSSAFINNTAIVAIFLPILLGVAGEFETAPSRLLIPMSYAAILGGTCSLIGTSTNLLVNDLLIRSGEEALWMFEFTPLGLIYAAVGLAYIYFVGRRLLPDRGSVSSYLTGGRGASEYMTEIQIPRSSPLAGKTVAEALATAHPEIRLLQIIRGEQIVWPPLDEVTILADDILLLKGDVNELLDLYRKEGVELLPGLKAEAERYEVKDMDLAELVITPNSPLIGRTLNGVHFRQHFGVSVMALQRHGAHLREQVADLPLRNGDVLLVMGDAGDVRELATFDEFLVLEGVREVVVRKAKAPVALAVVAGMVVAASVGIADIMVVAMTAALLMVLTRCLSLAEAYAALMPSVLVLIGGALALGEAMDRTGAAALLADQLVARIGELGPYAVLAAIYLITMAFTEVMSNNAAAVLMVPVALSAAAALGVDPRPYAIAVAFAGSASFSTPIGYQTNTLIYGPGGYRFSDFTRVGLPLNLLLWVIATISIPVFWPFYPSP